MKNNIENVKLIENSEFKSFFEALKRAIGESQDDGFDVEIQYSHTEKSYSALLINRKR